MHKEGAIAALRAMAELVQKEYALSARELQALVFSESIPATIFRNDATPLESVISYLSSTGLDTSDIARRVGRNANYVRTVQKRGIRHNEPTNTQYHIPLSLLAKESAGKAITGYLTAQGLSTKKIAELLDKDESTVWTWRKRAQGGAQ